MNGFEQYQYAEMMRQSRNSAIYHMLLARQGVAGGDVKQEDPTPPGPIVPEKTTFYFADSPDETYLIEGTLDRSKMIELGLYNANIGWIKQPTSTEIGNKVKSIGSDVFYGCSSLASVTIPDSVTSIGNNAFMNCDSLTSITIPSSVESIGQGAFFNTPLEELTMEDKYMSDVESMTNYAWSVPAGIPIKCIDGDLEAPDPGGS